MSYFLYLIRIRFEQINLHINKWPIKGKFLIILLLAFMLPQRPVNDEKEGFHETRKSF